MDKEKNDTDDKKPAEDKETTETDTYDVVEQKAKVDETRHIYIGNISIQEDEESLKRLLGQYAEVVSVHIFSDSNFREAVAEFKNQKDAVDTLLNLTRDKTCGVGKNPLTITLYRKPSPTPELYFSCDEELEVEGESKLASSDAEIECTVTQSEYENLEAAYYAECQYADGYPVAGYRIPHGFYFEGMYPGYFPVPDEVMNNSYSGYFVPLQQAAEDPEGQQQNPDQAEPYFGLPAPPPGEVIDDAKRTQIMYNAPAYNNITNYNTNLVIQPPLGHGPYGPDVPVNMVPGPYYGPFLEEAFTRYEGLKGESADTAEQIQKPVPVPFPVQGPAMFDYPNQIPYPPVFFNPSGFPINPGFPSAPVPVPGIPMPGVVPGNSTSAPCFPMPGTVPGIQHGMVHPSAAFPIGEMPIYGGRPVERDFAQASFVHPAAAGIPVETTSRPALAGGRPVERDFTQASFVHPAAAGIPVKTASHPALAENVYALSRPYPYSPPATMQVNSMNRRSNNYEMAPRFRSMGQQNQMCYTAPGSSTEAILRQNQYNSSCRRATTGGLDCNNNRVAIRHPFYEPQTVGPDGANIFIFYLMPNMGEWHLRVLFQPFGKILSEKVFRDAAGNSKCFGFVSFADPFSAYLAIIYRNRLQISHKILKVTLKKERICHRKALLNE